MVGKSFPRKDFRSSQLPNEASIRRLAGAILMEQTEEWTVQRAGYMTLETLAPVGRVLEVVEIGWRRNLRVT